MVQALIGMSRETLYLAQMLRLSKCRGKMLLRTLFAHFILDICSFCQKYLKRRFLRNALSRGAPHLRDLGRCLKLPFKF
jgi:hypothetical protein